MAWRREDNEERPTKGLSGLPPAAYARRLAETESRITPGLSIEPLLKTGVTPVPFSQVLLRPHHDGQIQTQEHHHTRVEAF